MEKFKIIFQAFVILEKDAWGGGIGHQQFMYAAMLIDLLASV